MLKQTQNLLWIYSKPPHQNNGANIKKHLSPPTKQSPDLMLNTLVPSGDQKPRKLTSGNSKPFKTPSSRSNWLQQRHQHWASKRRNSNPTFKETHSTSRLHLPSEITASTQHFTPSRNQRSKKQSIFTYTNIITNNFTYIIPTNPNIPYKPQHS